MRGLLPCGAGPPALPDGDWLDPGKSRSAGRGHLHYLAGIGRTRGRASPVGWGHPLAGGARGAEGGRKDKPFSLRWVRGPQILFLLAPLPGLLLHLPSAALKSIVWAGL